jgi:hypothetical protein
MSPAMVPAGLPVSLATAFDHYGFEHIHCLMHNLAGHDELR